MDVFTRTPLQGNALAVVHDADGVDDATMLAFARETRLSETTFVQSPAHGDTADYVDRIWTMGGELPFAGHPSLGTAVAVAYARGEHEARYVQRTSVGLQPVDVVLDADGGAYASMVQATPAAPEELDALQVLAAAGLAPGDLLPDLPPVVMSTGLPHVLACVRTREVLGRARPAPELLELLLTDHAASVLYLAWVDRAQGTAEARGFYVDPGGITEDPATGSAAGPLCAYLAAHGGGASLEVHQGTTMGRPSRLNCALEPGGVRVGGACVVLGAGTVRLR